MRRKFECKNCKTRFEADDSKEVFCPNCASDNIDYAHFQIPVFIWKSGIGIATIAFLCFIAKIIITSKVSEPDNLLQSEDSLKVERKELVDTYEEETNLPIPPMINVENLKFEANGYSFKVNVEHAPTNKFYVAVMDTYNNKKIIARSENGLFEKIPYSNADGGVYDIALIDASTDSLICKIDKPGFIKQQAVATKMTIAELQDKINHCDQSLIGAGENAYLNPEYQLKLIGLPDNAINKPSTLGEVFEKLENEIWISVKVSSLEYDDKNRISKIELSVKE